MKIGSIFRFHVAADELPRRTGNGFLLVVGETFVIRSGHVDCFIMFVSSLSENSTVQVVLRDVIRSKIDSGQMREYYFDDEFVC